MSIFSVQHSCVHDVTRRHSSPMTPYSIIEHEKHYFFIPPPTQQFLTDDDAHSSLLDLSALDLDQITRTVWLLFCPVMSESGVGELVKQYWVKENGSPREYEMSFSLARFSHLQRVP